MNDQTSIRISSADRATLELAARLTGRGFTEYIREVAVLVAVTYVNEMGKGDRLPAEHRKLLDRSFESAAVSDVVGAEKSRRLKSA